MFTSRGHAKQKATHIHAYGSGCIEMYTKSFEDKRNANKSQVIENETSDGQHT